jgi:hypothetical protein
VPMIPPLPTIVFDASYRRRRRRRSRKEERLTAFERVFEERRYTCHFFAHSADRRSGGK